MDGVHKDGVGGGGGGEGGGRHLALQAASQAGGPPPPGQRTPPAHTLFLVLEDGMYIINGSVGDPEPDPDPHVFRPPGSGFISQRYRSGSGSFPCLKDVLSGLK